jgi:L-aminopeptidase/D-esterase-like protein
MRLLPALLLLTSTLHAQTRPRARALGVPFDGTPAPLNAITDVAGVTVGHATIILGQGKLVVGQGPVRTGVTAVFPRGATNGDPVFGGWFTLNGNGEMTGTTWLEEAGFLAGPVMITNTHSVGIVRDCRDRMARQKGLRVRLVAPHCRRDVGWLAQRHQRLSRHQAAYLRGAR